MNESDLRTRAEALGGTLTPFEGRAGLAQFLLYLPNVGNLVCDDLEEVSMILRRRGQHDSHPGR